MRVRTYGILALGLIVLALVAPAQASGATPKTKVQTRKHSVMPVALATPTPAKKEAEPAPLISVQIPAEPPEQKNQQTPVGTQRRQPEPRDDEYNSVPHHRGNPQETIGPVFELRLERARESQDAVYLQPGNYDVGLPNGAVRTITVHGQVGGNRSAVEILKPADLVLYSGEVVRAGDQYFALLAVRVSPQGVRRQSLMPSGHPGQPSTLQPKPRTPPVNSRD